MTKSWDHIIRYVKKAKTKGFYRWLVSIPIQSSGVKEWKEKIIIGEKQRILRYMVPINYIR